MARTNARRVYGYLQPAVGSVWDLECKTMNGKPKGPKYVSHMRKPVGDNVRALMERAFEMSSNKPRELAKRAGVSLSTVQRVISGEIGPSLDILEQLATALDVSTYQLVLPNLDAENPQVVTGASIAEKRLYSRWRLANRENTERSH